MHVVEPSTRPVDQQQPAEPPRRNRRRHELTPYVLSLPTLVVLGALLGYPLVKMVMLSFQNLTLRALFSGEAPPWVGFDNYVSALEDPFFWTVVLRTVVVAA